jgi:hypothetical protein
LSTFSIETLTCTPLIPSVSRYADRKLRWCIFRWPSVRAQSVR